MNEPSFTRHPVEYFGHTFVDNTPIAREHQANQYCPFLDAECKKPRKSEPHIKIGVCTVGYKPQFINSFIPVVICPHRFDNAKVFEDIADHYFPPEEGFCLRWVPEVSIGLGGSIDYVLAKFAIDSPEQVVDFLCAEFQAAGTTGTPWEAIVEFRENGHFNKASYKYGINWANEFAKTMMQQAYKKGMIVESWHKRLVSVLQDVGMAYLKAGAYDTTGLNEPAGHNDTIQFYTIGMEWNEDGGRWQLNPTGISGCNMEGVRKLLSGSESGGYILLEGFIENIRRRLNMA